jgi:2-phosphosulfolactate phosphatase
MSFTDQTAFDVRCEWGPEAVAALAECRTFIVVDVLSFSTCVSVAAQRQVVVVPCRAKGADAAMVAERHRAVLAGQRGAGYSLSPASLMGAPAGLRLVLPSPNGAAVSLLAATRGRVLAGCLRNVSAVCARAAALGGPFGVIPAGERWQDGTLRPALEDLLGAGAIARLLPGRPSPEAGAAIAAFEAASRRLAETLASCSSGRELVERGFPEDVRLAAALDADTVAPELVEGCFAASPAQSPGAGLPRTRS